MLRRLHLRDFVIVPELELELGAGFCALTGETGAGKSILIDAVQLALGGRGDATVVREGAARAEIAASFDPVPALGTWLEEAGIEPGDELLLRRWVDAQGKGRAWINGTPVTVAQLRTVGETLVDIHGQHAWQGLTRPVSVRRLLDAYAGIDTAPLEQAWAGWRQAQRRLDDARARQADLQRERERLGWQIGELDKLAPGEHEWDELNTDHQRLSHAQSLLEAASLAVQRLSEDELSADALCSQAIDALDRVAHIDPQLGDVAGVLHSAQAQLQDAVHTLNGYLRHQDLDPDRLAELDERMSLWVGLARRYRRTPQELPALLQSWHQELRTLDEAADLAGLERAAQTAQAAFQQQAQQVSKARRQAAPRLSQAVTAAMQHLGMGGGRFEVALTAEPAQSHGLEAVEFLVAGHAGSTPRPLGKVASGGELSRIALAIAVTTSALGEAGTLIFDEIDAGVGGAVADAVGRLMKQLGADRQVLAVTHLPQVAACADTHCVVSKASAQGVTTSTITPVQGEARVAEIARMLGGERLSATSVAHAQELLLLGAQAAESAAGPAALSGTAATPARRGAARRKP